MIISDYSSYRTGARVEERRMLPTGSDIGDIIHIGISVLFFVVISII
jgi:hypothetical protein